jgi:hypothetical protein
MGRTKRFLEYAFVTTFTTRGWIIALPSFQNFFVDPVALDNGEIKAILMTIAVSLCFILGLIYFHVLIFRLYWPILPSISCPILRPILHAILRPIPRPRITIGDVTIEHVQRCGGLNGGRHWPDADVLIPLLQRIDVESFTSHEFDMIVQWALDLALLEHKRQLLEVQSLQSEDLLDRSKRGLEEAEKLVAEWRRLNGAQN